LRSRSAVTVIAVLAAVVFGCGNFGDTKPDAPNPNAGPQQPQQPQQPPATSQAPATPAGPVTAFADGTYEIGIGPGLVPPGKYKGVVPADSFGCYWERQNSTGGGFDAIITNGVAGKGEPIIVTIAPSDKGFKTSGCGTWSKA
jgi:hypothetical protein